MKELKDQNGSKRLKKKRKSEKEKEAETRKEVTKETPFSKIKEDQQKVCKEENYKVVVLKFWAKARQKVLDEKI